MKYDSFDEACEESVRGQAVAKIVVNYKGGPHKAEIVKPRNGDAMIHFYHSAIPIRKATAHEVDSVKQWSPY